MTTATPAPERALDPITLEILSNRLWVTNDEAAATLRRVSGSPVATEICDFNTALMRADGEAFMVGAYMSPLSMGHHLIVQSILRDYSANPGIGPGDMFLCSDPYRGNTHQNDVTVVAPVHADGELLAWTGISVHQVDVGGPVYGSQASVGATSIYQEALPMPPLKIVEHGLLRRDIEEEYLIRSRTRDLNALDLRAKIAANALARDRILECADRYGVDTLVAAMDAIIDLGEQRLRRRLVRLRDGVWRHRSYMDEAPGATHDFHLEMTKAGDRLVLDFTETGPQAGAIFNCTRGGLLGGVLSSVLPILFYGMPWCPAAALRVLDVRSKRGTLVDATWPAGTCKATTAAIATVNTITNVCLGKMMSTACDEVASRAMAAWMAAATVQELGGVDQRGEPFGATMLDPMAGGGGARGDRDGIDNGGVVRAVKLRIANVETYEFRYPLLYLHRRRLVDSGGAGMHRGGVGVSIMFTPHGVDGIPTNVMHSINYQAPATAGILGGHPGATNSMVVLRDSDVWTRVARGELPADPRELEGRLEVIPMMAASHLAHGDVYRSTTGGGGGLGDPLERDPARVARDVVAGAISAAQADALYGVVLGAGAEVDVPGTRRRRRQLRRERLQQAAAPVAARGQAQRAPAWHVGPSVSLYAVGDAQMVVGCRCGQLFADLGRSYKDGLAAIEHPVGAAGPGVDPYGLGSDFVFRRYVCPRCARLVETEVARRGAAALTDVELAPPAAVPALDALEPPWA